MQKHKIKSKKNTTSVKNIKNPKILWANSYCLLDTSSGASISVRQILLELVKRGFEIDIVGATIFDTDKGVEGLGSLWEKIKTADASTVNVPDGPLLHRLIKTKEITRDQQTLSEANRFINLYQSRLDEFNPDLVFFYGGNAIDFLIPGEARVRGIPSASYLVNANYQGKRWCRDVDLIVTDTNATANFYKDTQGFKPVPIGKFIDPANVISKSHERKHLTFINPSYAKGAGIVCQLAIVLERLRPDIKIEVVESRGDWTSVVKDVSRSFFENERDSLSNVILTPNTKNISEVYKRSRVLIAPSLWWESGSRVLAEAMLNGIPAIVTNKGGSPEIVGEGGVTIDLPQECYNHPYNKLPKAEYLTPIIELIETLWDNEGAYLNLMAKAIKRGMEHKIDVSAAKIESEFMKFIHNRSKTERNIALKNMHKHNIVEEKIPTPKDADVKEEKTELKKSKNKDVNAIITDEINKTKNKIHKEKKIIDNSSIEKSIAKKIIGNFNFYNLKNDFCLNLINPGGNWILEKISQILNQNFENSQEYIYNEPSLYESRNSPLNEKNKINYFIHYNLFRKKSENLDCAYFTHIEEDIPELKNKFINSIKLVDGPIFQNEMYFNRFKNKNKNSFVIPTGVDGHFQPKIKLGVIGRDYNYTDRKNKSFVKKVQNLPFVDMHFTNGVLDEADLPNFYHSCDYIFVGSKHEGGPMCLPEALACGKEIIFPKNVGMASMFENAKGIIFYSLDNINELISILELKFKQKQEIATAVEQISWQNFVTEHEKFFQRLWMNRD
ncbi:glycosyltransferase [Paracoccaceae bacterium]|nr:glycosyltransferase [Paracoccaceae bacterium]